MMEATSRTRGGSFHIQPIFNLPYTPRERLLDHRDRKLSLLSATLDTFVIRHLHFLGAALLSGHHHHHHNHYRRWSLINLPLRLIVLFR